jgi:hypothetical protein
MPSLHKCPNVYSNKFNWLVGLGMGSLVAVSVSA